ncbi:hypothetical protein AERO8C_50285 [Aeromonas veronii]|uniref:Uncharacterized protein n=1 Tax=Aeromonas veronii TaxID=654 RepID=A0A653L875_AERVE|nr:hypothetical protein AERO8C_50285 [Aeromonas veronii]
MGRPVLHRCEQKTRDDGSPETKQHLMTVPPDRVGNPGQGKPTVELPQPEQHGDGSKQSSEQEEGSEPQAEQRDDLLFLMAIEDLMHEGIPIEHLRCQL